MSRPVGQARPPNIQPKSDPKISMCDRSAPERRASHQKRFQKGIQTETVKYKIRILFIFCDETDELSSAVRRTITPKRDLPDVWRVGWPLEAPLARPAERLAGRVASRGPPCPTCRTSGGSGGL